MYTHAKISDFCEVLPACDVHLGPKLRYVSFHCPKSLFGTELWVLRTFGGGDFSLIFIGAQSVSEFLWDRLRASIKFPVMPKRAQYARFSGECFTPGGSMNPGSE
eukprot:COSAG02_NODE_1447_length_12575_cov_8.479400_4_plen_105_part_00